MNREYYFNKDCLKLFGEYYDEDIKTETICFRVSKKSKDYFTAHANGAYGSTQKAMESIFKNYMESINYKRGKIDGTAVLLIPKFYSKKELGNIKDSEIIPFDDEGLWHEQYLDKFTFKLEDNITDDVVVKSYYVSKGINEYDRRYFNEDLEIDGYYVDVDDYIVIPFYFNNYLDPFKNGVYSSIGRHEHSGLIISTYNDIDFYIYMKFSDSQLLNEYSLISNNEAYELAMSVDNVPLARIIASFNNDEELFDTNIALLKNKRLQLEKEIMKIDEQLKKID